MINFDPEKGLVNAIKGIAKWFAWLAFALSTIVLILVSFVDDFNFDFSLKSFTLFAIISSICSIVIYFTFQTDGQMKGAIEPEYVNNLTAYRMSIAGRPRKRIAEFIEYVRGEQRAEYINEICGILGMSETDIRKLTIKDLKKRHDITRREKKRVRNVLRNHYPSSVPNSPSVVLNILSDSHRGSHGTDIKAKKRFLKRQASIKITTTIIMLLLTAAIAISGGADNIFQSIVKIVLMLFTFLFSLYSGFHTGLKAVGTIEKDILANIVRFLQDMDAWIEAQPAPEPIKAVVPDLSPVCPPVTATVVLDTTANETEPARSYADSWEVQANG